MSGEKEAEKYNKPRNAWQSLEYSPLGAAVSPPGRYYLNITLLPPGERRYTYPITDRFLFYTVELRRYWSEAHQIYIRCSQIITAIDAYIQIVCQILMTCSIIFVLAGVSLAYSCVYSMCF